MGDVEQLRILLLEQSHRVWSAVLLGGTPQRVRMREMMRAPKVGDSVFVYLASPRTDPRLRLGTLREIRSRTNFTIETFDGELVNWDNAEALRLFTSDDPR